MYHHTYSKVANPARGQLHRENEHFPVPVRPKRSWSRETGSAVPSRVSLLISSILRLNLVLTYGIPPDFPAYVHIYLLPPYAIGSAPSLSGHHAISYRWLHRRESAGTRPVNIKVVPNGCCLGGLTMDHACQRKLNQRNTGIFFPLSRSSLRI